MIVKGQNFRVKLGGKYVALATSCTIHIASSLEDSSSKDSADDWQEQEVTGRSWDGSADALYSVDDDNTGMNGIGALDAALAGEEVDIEYDLTSGDKNRTQVASSVTYGGKAYVNDITVTAENRANTKYAMKFTGNGALKKK